MAYDEERSGGAWDPVRAPQGGGGAPSSPGGYGHGATGVPGPVPQVGTLSDYERNWAPWIHISALVGLVGIPFGHVLGPLVCWLITKERSAFLNDQGKEVLNFMISVSIILVVLFVVVFMSMVLAVLIVPIAIMVLAFVAMVVVGLFALIHAVIGGIQASKGVWYRYPMRIQFLK